MDPRLPDPSAGLAAQARTPTVQHPTATSVLVEQLFSNEVRDVANIETMPGACEQLFARISAGLSRWFGRYGSNALLTRALARAAEGRPSLACVSVIAGDTAGLTGFSESAASYGADATVEGAIATLIALAELMGRLIGDDLATTLLQQGSKMQQESRPTPIDVSDRAGTQPAPSTGVLNSVESHD
ncbi:MAG: hypothetical protein ABI442_01735 [Gemmatimonadaceae bacterium]